MEFTEWNPAYQAVLAAFPFQQRADERTRDRLASLCRRRRCVDPTTLPLAEQPVVIAGGASTLSAELPAARDERVVIAASDAGARLADLGWKPDLIVTDLDGDPARTHELAQAGIPVAVHAHGDNQSAIDQWVPEFPPKTLLPTTQAAPVGPVYNFGGFTDGDRAAFLADHFGASRLHFAGWEFDDPTVDPMKRRKLQWAARLLRWLEQRRDEEFSILDDRRDAISLSWRV